MHVHLQVDQREREREKFIIVFLVAEGYEDYGMVVFMVVGGLMLLLCYLVFAFALVSINCLPQRKGG